MTPRQFRNTIDNTVVTDDGCVEWLGKTTPKGYGTIEVDSQWTPVHRAVYEHLNGALPQDMDVHHTCVNPLCIRPSHLKAINNQEHREEHKRPDAATYCKYGHEMTPANIITVPSRPNVKRCRLCMYEAIKKSKAKNKKPW